MRSPHAIEQVRFSAGLLACHCGWIAPRDTPAGLSSSYQAHRKAVGLNPTSGSDMGVTGVGSQPHVIRRRSRRHL